MSLENAELAKILVNAYITTKISFANMVADLCERLPGGDAQARLSLPRDYDADDLGRITRAAAAARLSYELQIAN